MLSLVPNFEGAELVVSSEGGDFSVFELDGVAVGEAFGVGVEWRCVSAAELVAQEGGAVFGRGYARGLAEDGDDFGAGHADAQLLEFLAGCYAAGEEGKDQGEGNFEVHAKPGSC